MLYHDATILVGLVYTSLLFMVVPLVSALESLDDSLIEAAYDLGGNGWSILRQIVVPHAAPGIVAGSIVVFMLTLGNFRNDVAVDQRQRTILAIDRRGLGVDAHQVIDRRQHVLRGDRAVGDGAGDRACRSGRRRMPRLDAAAGEEVGVGVAPVAAAVPFELRRAAHFAHDADQRVLSSRPRPFQVAHQHERKRGDPAPAAGPFFSRL